MDLSCLTHSISRHELPGLHSCLLPLLSKRIGYTIIAASTVCKVPQIYLILKNRSIEGLSVPSFELEVVGFTISLAYCMFKQLAFSAYGELVFLVLQSVIQVGLMYYYSPFGIGKWIKSGLYPHAYSFFRSINFIGLFLICSFTVDTLFSLCQL
ncbi:hypothetical protein KP509_14G089500 [Ceratopteris richardii]|uniref:Mannose-P-dolichol utilization defect 1 protein homolog n=1 Tax=Ceratopteris richardii TaxID=49495 RepID=A0A8T2TBU4_CERRI|nr:hypothetical protein KP509_14G089500 [Ceratopteris richardii]